MPGILRQIAEYLYLKKRPDDAPKGFFVKAMHGMNRISIFMFLIVLIIIAVRFFTHHR